MYSTIKSPSLLSAYSHNKKSSTQAQKLLEGYDTIEAGWVLTHEPNEKKLNAMEA